MRIGYPCVNTTIGCTGSAAFRLKNYSAQRMEECIDNNLRCLEKILIFNEEMGIRFFRISSDIIPFASHPICDYDWKGNFKKDLKRIGNFIKANKMRISMHPDQFIVINSPNRNVRNRSIEELKYHAQLLDLMGLDRSAKIQLHVGGVYGNKAKAVEDFQDSYQGLPGKIKKRLVIENDHRSYSASDCLSIHEKCKIPVLFDYFHHECYNNSEDPLKIFKHLKWSWTKRDGPAMVDYSSQLPGGSRGSHSTDLDPRHFKDFLRKFKGQDFDLMLEIKNKERSVLKAIKNAKELGIVINS